MASTGEYNFMQLEKIATQTFPETRTDERSHIAAGLRLWLIVTNAVNTFLELPTLGALSLQTRFNKMDADNLATKDQMEIAERICVFFERMHGDFVCRQGPMPSLQQAIEMAEPFANSLMRRWQRRSPRL